MTKLSDTQRIILSQASQRDDRLVVPPKRLPAAARRAVAKALMKQGLVRDEHASTYAAREAWQIEGRSRPDAPNWRSPRGPRSRRDVQS